MGGTKRGSLILSVVLGLGLLGATKAGAQIRTNGYNSGSSGTAASGEMTGVVRKLMNGPMGGLQVPSSLSPYVKFGLPTADPIRQRDSLEALVGSSVEPLKWPELPRVWWKMENYNAGTDTVYYGLQLSQSKLTGTIRNSMSFKYTRSTSFVLIGSLRSNSKAVTGSNFDGGQFNTDDLVIRDDTSGMMYPNVREDYPMVGLCLYDMSSTSERSTNKALDFMGNGGNHERSEGFATAFTLYSNFFQLDPNKPVYSHYVKERCQKMFEATMKKWVEEQLTIAQRAFRTETQSTCLRERGGADRTTVGDRGCFAWHSEFPDSIQKNTVPRCARGDDDLFACTMKVTTEGQTCPMTQGNDAKIVPSKVMGSISPLSAPCDESLGLTCVPTLPRANVVNLEKNRLFLSHDQLSKLGVCRRTGSSSPNAR